METLEGKVLRRKRLKTLKEKEWKRLEEKVLSCKKWKTFGERILHTDGVHCLIRRTFDLYLELMKTKSIPKLQFH